MTPDEYESELDRWQSHAASLGEDNTRLLLKAQRLAADNKRLRDEIVDLRQCIGSFLSVSDKHNTSQKERFESWQNLRAALDQP